MSGSRAEWVGRAGEEACERNDGGGDVGVAGVGLGLVGEMGSSSWGDI